MNAEWKIEAVLGDRKVAWSYDEEADFRRAWRHMSRWRTTIDTGDPVTGASVRMPNGDIFYLGEALPRARRRS